MLRNKPTAWLLIIGGLLIASCAGVNRDAATATLEPAATRSGEITPYQTATGTATPTPTDPATPTFLPSATPTPQTHVVKKGEDMSGIALNYHVDLAELIKANPTVTPRFLSIGTVLVIPPAVTPTPGSTQDPAQPSLAPTAQPLEPGKLTCTRTQEGGVWCFQPVKNQQTHTLEGISAIFHLTDGQGKKEVTKNAALLLDTLAAGASQPLVAYFSPESVSELGSPLKFSSELVDVLASADDGRYLPAKSDQQKVLIDPQGLSATVTLNVIPQLSGNSMNRIWVALVAYDANGSVVGVRRWENTPTSPLVGGHAYPVSAVVYSVAGQISRVEATVEVRP